MFSTKLSVSMSCPTAGYSQQFSSLIAPFQKELLQAQRRLSRLQVTAAVAERLSSNRGVGPSSRHASTPASKDGGSRRGKTHQEKVTEADRKRLSKVLAAAGVASRRAAEDLIFAGAVKVNGQLVLVPQTPVHPTKDQVLVHDRPIRAQAQKKYYFAVNKPKGYLCSNKASRESQSRLVVDLFEDFLAEWKKDKPKAALPPRLFTVGRLDVQSVGLLFVTNDGAWAQEVTHPSSNLTREYVVTLDQPATRKQLQDIAAGSTVDGVFVQPTALEHEVPDTQNRPRLRITVAEGRNREVRTLVSNAGLEVTYLKRVRVGGYRIPRNLAFGEYVELKPHEVRRVLDRGAQNQI